VGGTVGCVTAAGGFSREGDTYTMTDANDENAEKARATYIVDRLTDVHGVIAAKRCDPIEGYDEDVGARFEELHVTVEDGTTAATGLLDAYMASVGYHANGVAPSDHTDARRRTVRRTFVSRPPAEVYAIRSSDLVTAGDATEEWAENALFNAEDPRAE
jgi:hypothetical protein